MSVRLAFASFFVAVALSLAGCANSVASASDDVPAWLESDSAVAIARRVALDFSIPYDEGTSMLVERFPEVVPESIPSYIDKKYIETSEVDGNLCMFRKTLRNFPLLNPALNGGWTNRGFDASVARLAYADSVIRWSEGRLPLGGAHRVKFRFSIDVPYHPVLKDDTLSVWMPFPLESDRQTDIRLVSVSSPDFVVSAPEQSAHRTLFMRRPVMEGDTAHFEYVAEFTARGQYFSPAEIKGKILPYDKDSDVYQRFTAFDGKHYVNLDSLALSIVGDETNPFVQSELVYDHIVHNFPWAGAREYSTIPSIPLYVVERGYGDCGQVALLYISLMRSLGVPARWESGWMLHPGEKNYHDWAEVFFEGVGWVPVDVSFGRYSGSSDAKVRNFYSSGIDSYRFAANAGVGDVFFPPKRFVRSETVDSQAGEVECSKGNLFYPAWDQHLEIISCVAVE